MGACFRRTSNMLIFCGVVLLFMEEILHQLIGSLSYHLQILQGFIHPTWCRRQQYVVVFMWTVEIGPNTYSPENYQWTPKLFGKKLKICWDLFRFHFLFFSFWDEIPVLPLVVHKSIRKRFTYIYQTNQLHVGKWTVNWSNGYGTPCLKKNAWAQVSRQAYTAPGRPSEDVQWHSVEL